MPLSHAPIPHLIHIGFPKCASTFMQHWFAAHPQVSFQPGSLGGVYNVYELIADSLRESGIAKCRVTSCESLSDPRDPASFGEVETTPVEQRRAAMGRVCAELAARFPNASILMITRNQADMTISGYSQMIKQGAHIRDIDYARFAAEGFRDLHPFDFDLALRIYREHFGGRVLALPFEMLVEQRPAFLAAIAGFMGVDKFDVASGRLNEALDSEQLYWYPRISRMLRMAPGEWLRRSLVGLHCRMIAIGAWRPLLKVLKLIFGAKSVPLTIPERVLAKLEIDCEELLRSEFYAPYRDIYRGTGRTSEAF